MSKPTSISTLFGPAPPPPSELGRYRVLSPSCGLRVSPLCLGAMSLGSAWNDFMGQMDKEQTFKLLDAFYENGGNFIDTANNYQFGESETLIGDWMKSKAIRDEMVIATKFTTGYQEGAKIRANYQGNHLKSMLLSVDASLKNLQTSYIDILYLHWWDYTTSIEEMMQGLNNLVRSGKVLYLGISDTPAWIVAQANQYAKDHGLAQFVIYQGRWSIMQRDLERDIIPMCRSFGMAIAPWNAMGGGKFQSQKAIEERKAAGEGLRAMRGPEQTPEEVKISAALDKVAQEIGGKASVTAVALAYVMQKTPYVFPIIGGRKTEHLLANIEALSITLTSAQVEALEATIPFDIGFPLNMVGTDPHTNGGAVSFLMDHNANYSFVQGPHAIAKGQ